MGSKSLVDGVVSMVLQIEIMGETDPMVSAELVVKLGFMRPLLTVSRKYGLQ